MCVESGRNHSQVFRGGGKFAHYIFSHFNFQRFSFSYSFFNLVLYRHDSNDLMAISIK